jgi:hypothetical protein
MKIEDIKVGMLVSDAGGGVGTVARLHGNEVWCKWEDSDNEMWEFASSLTPVVEPCEDKPVAVREDVGSAATSKHYNSKPIQPIELMQALMSPEEFVGFCKGNFIKYSMRAGSKEGENSDKDTNKAKQYFMWWKLAEEGVTIDPRKHVV